MLQRALRPATLLAIAVGLEHAALAEDGVNAVIAGNVSATDNAFQDDGGNKHPDIFAQIRPGLLFGYETPRSVYSLTTDVEATDYVFHARQFAFTVHARGSAAWELTDKTLATALLSVGSGKTNALAGRQSPDQNTVTGLLPGGANDVYQLDATQGFTHELAKTVRVSDTIGGDWVQTNGENGAITRSQQATLAASIQKTFPENAIGLEGGAAVVRLVQYVPATDATVQSGRLDEQFVPRASAFWRHDLSRKFSFALNGGVTLIQPFGHDSYNPDRALPARTIAPTGFAAINYTDEWGNVALAGGHYVATNMQIAENTITDSVTLNGTVPLVWVESHGRPPRYTASGSIGVFRNKIVDQVALDGSGMVAAPAGDNSYIGEHVDVGVNYIPRESQSQVFSLRYTFQHQGRDPNAIIPIPAFTSNTISFVFTLRFPEKVQVKEPKLQSVRADGSDLKSAFGDKDADDPNAGDGKGVGGNANKQNSGDPNGGGDDGAGGNSTTNGVTTGPR